MNQMEDADFIVEDEDLVAGEEEIEDDPDKPQYPPLGLASGANV
jgi:hypothetical protein